MKVEIPKELLKEVMKEAFDAGVAYIMDWERGSGGNEPNFEEWYESRRTT